LNLCMIAPRFCDDPYFDSRFMAWPGGVFIGRGVLPIAVQYVSGSDSSCCRYRARTVSTKGVKRINDLMLPALFGVSVPSQDQLCCWDTVLAFVPGDRQYSPGLLLPRTRIIRACVGGLWYRHPVPVIRAGAVSPGTAGETPRPFFRNLSGLAIRIGHCLVGVPAALALLIG